jgi:hypothetical protein
MSDESLFAAAPKPFPQIQARTPIPFPAIFIKTTRTTDTWGHRMSHQHEPANGTRLHSLVKPIFWQNSPSYFCYLGARGEQGSTLCHLSCSWAVGWEVEAKRVANGSKGWGWVESDVNVGLTKGIRRGKGIRAFAVQTSLANRTIRKPRTQRDTHLSLPCPPSDSIANNIPPTVLAIGRSR